MTIDARTRVLIVEDQPHDRRLLVRLLGRDTMSEYEIFEADSLDEARAVLILHSIDVILADYRLSDGLCTELLEHMHEVARPAFIVFSGSTTMESAQRLLGMGIEDYINKSSLNVQRLSIAIHNAASRRRYLRALAHVPEPGSEFARFTQEISLNALDHHQRDLDGQIDRLAAQFSFVNQAEEHGMVREFMARSMARVLNEPLSALRANLSFMREDLGALRQGASLEEADIETLGDLHDSLRDLDRASEQIEDISQSLRVLSASSDLVCDEIVVEALFERCVERLCERLSLDPSVATQPSARTPVSAHETSLVWVLTTLVVPALSIDPGAADDRPLITLSSMETERQVVFHIDDATERAARMLTHGDALMHLRRKDSDGQLFVLSLAADAIKRMGGELELVPREGGGTRFVLSLPKFVHDGLDETTISEHLAAPSRVVEPLGLELSDVLVIEDNLADVYLFEHMLERSIAGVTLRHTDTLEGGLSLVDQSAPDLVFLDLGLPDAHGTDGLHRLLGAHPNLPVIVLTGRSDDDVARAALGQGAQDYLVKGAFTGSELKRSIQYALARSQNRGAAEVEQDQALEISLEEVRHGLATMLRRSVRALRTQSEPLGHVARGSTASDVDAQLLSEHLKTLEHEAAALERLASSVDAAPEFTRNLPLNMESLVSGAVERYIAPRLRAQITFKGPRELVHGDRHQLERAIAAAILNAIESRVSVRVSVLVMWERRGSDIVLSISDDGPGMIEDVRRRAFEPFFTTRRERAGVGLAMVREAVSSAGGWVTLQSEVGKGTVLMMCLQRSVTRRETTPRGVASLASGEQS